MVYRWKTALQLLCSLRSLSLLVPDLIQDHVEICPNGFRLLDRGYIPLFFIRSARALDCVMLYI